MNPSVVPRLTRAAEGLQRRRFTVDEVEAMVEAGIMDEDERVELIGAGPVKFAQDASGLTLTLPEKAPNEYAYAFIVRT